MTIGWWQLPTYPSHGWRSSSGLTGFAITLGCSNCGAKLGGSKLCGVTVECSYCGAALLTPGFLISDSQQGFFRRILVLRGKLESKIEAPSLLAYGLGLIHFCSLIGWCLLADKYVTFGYFTEGLLGPAICSFGASIFWFVAQGTKDNIWASLPALGFVLGPLGCTVMGFLSESQNLPLPWK